ncbi:MAG TPA: hypothetical protein GXX70_00055 [Tepidimicrobium sp.]|nr:hypothetical protein [Tepidimicrobium sp.]
MIKITIGFFVGVFVSWVSVMIGIEQQTYKQIKKEELYDEILNERNFYKKFYEREFHKYNSGH